MIKSFSIDVKAVDGMTTNYSLHWLGHKFPIGEPLQYADKGELREALGIGLWQELKLRHRLELINARICNLKGCGPEDALILENNGEITISRLRRGRNG